MGRDRRPAERGPGAPAGPTVEATIERIAHGGEGVAHVEGLVAFVPWTAPGDRVRAEVVERRPRWARAQLLEVLSAGAPRVEPGCPVFGTCGGCQLQHLAREEQLAVKARVVEDAIARIGGVELAEPVACRPAAAPWHYRRRAVFTWRWDGAALALGFHAAALPLGSAPGALVDIHACPIFAEAGNVRLGALRRGLAPKLAGEPPAEGRLALRALAPGLVQCGVFAGDRGLAERLARACEAASGIPATWGGWAPGGPPFLAPGAPRHHARLVYRGLDLGAGFDSFLQADLAAAEPLYDAALEELDASPAERVVDGYAGIGVLTCQLAAGGVRVTAVEVHPGAAADLRANAARVPGGRVHVLEIPAEAVDWSRPRPDRVLLNPPRAGCPPRVLEGLSRSTAQRLVYVSCEPTTLARDLRRLAGAWRVTRVRAFDLFPQTAHVETVVRLERR